MRWLLAALLQVGDFVIVVQCGRSGACVGLLLIRIGCQDLDTILRGHTVRVAMSETAGIEG